MVATAARTLLESLDRLPNVDDRTKICIIGVDTCLHFFGLAPGSTEPTMLVVGDLDDVFLPMPTDLLVSLTEARAGIESLLGRLSDMFKETQIVGSAMGPALQAAYKLIVRRLRNVPSSSHRSQHTEQHRRQGLCALIHPALDGSRRTQEPGRPKAARHVQGVDPPPAGERLLQEARHGLLPPAGLGRHVALWRFVHRRGYPQCVLPSFP
jgi:hypothetical protein